MTKSSNLLEMSGLRKFYEWQRHGFRWYWI